MLETVQCFGRIDSWKDMSKILEDLEKKPNFEHPKEFAWIPFARTKTKKD